MQRVLAQKEDEISMANASLKSIFSKEKKRYADTFSIHVMMRILGTLHENGRTNRTNLAGKAGLNYNKCIKYINLLLKLGWIKVIFDDTYNLVITEKGIEATKIFDH